MIRCYVIQVFCRIMSFVGYSFMIQVSCCKRNFKRLWSIIFFYLRNTYKYGATCHYLLQYFMLHIIYTFFKEGRGTLDCNGTQSFYKSVLSFVGFKTSTGQKTNEIYNPDNYQGQENCLLLLFSHLAVLIFPTLFAVIRRPN